MTTKEVGLSVRLHDPEKEDEADLAAADDGNDGLHDHDSPRRTDAWPPRPEIVRPLMTPVEAAQYLRLDETGAHTPASALRTLDYWRSRGELKATKYARRVWYRKIELDRFLEMKTES